MAYPLIDLLLAKLRTLWPKNAVPPPPSPTSAEAERSGDILLAALLRDFEEQAANRKDFLGPAATVGRNAAAAVKAGEYDKAWAFYQEQKALYMQHANQYGMTKKQAIALDASLHMGMANVLRLEGCHHDALAHAVYCVKGGSSVTSKAAEQKLRAYFNRCKLKNTTFGEVIGFASEPNGLANLRSTQAKVKDWIAKG